MNPRLLNAVFERTGEDERATEVAFYLCSIDELDVPPLGFVEPVERQEFFWKNQELIRKHIESKASEQGFDVVAFVVDLHKKRRGTSVSPYSVAEALLTPRPQRDSFEHSEVPFTEIASITDMLVQLVLKDAAALFKFP